MSARVAPSVLSADFAHLARDAEAARRGGAELLHVDVMDGHFVPNLTMGPVVVKALRACSPLPLDVHLMIEHPDQYLDAFAAAGAAMISVHVEAARHLQRTVQAIRMLGARPGVAINPATPLSLLEDILPEVDYIVLMSVNPGFGGQTFLPRTFAKLQALRRMLDDQRSAAEIEVDGGVDGSNAARLVALGADILVAGQAAFGDGRAEDNTRSLVKAAVAAASSRSVVHG